MKKIIILLLFSLMGLTDNYAQLYVQGLLHVQNGAELHVQNNLDLSTANGKLENVGIIEVEGDWSIDAMAEFAGNNAMGERKVIFKNNQFNTAGDQNINGEMTGANAFYNLEIDNTGTNELVEMNSDIQVTSELSFSNGKLDLNENDLLLDGQITGENEDNRVTGSANGEIIKTMMLNAPTGVNPGNIGAEITSAANLGMTTIKRSHLPVTVGSNQGIQRVFDISPTNDAGLNATLKFHYFDAELNGIPENELELWRNDGSGWTNEGVTNRDGTADVLELVGIDAFSLWTATNFANALPVELIAFNAQKFEKDKVLLSWITATEINNQGFRLERSNNSRDWEMIGFVEGNGNTTEKVNYSFIDETPLRDWNYYRLQQIDFDGTTTTSNVVAVQFSEEIIVGNLFPNPATVGEHFNLEITANNSTRLKSVIFDNLGRMVESTETLIEEGKNVLQINDSILPKGVYFVRLEIEESIFFKKMAVQ